MPHAESVFKMVHFLLSFDVELHRRSSDTFVPSKFLKVAIYVEI